MSTAVGRLVGTELKLMMRDPLVLTFVFAFPVLTMLIIGGAFGTAPNPGFDNVNPAHWYVASYLTVVIAATGLVMVPVHLASYRERGVLRRFAAAGFPRWSFAIAQLAVGLVTTMAACGLLLIVAAPVYGIPPVHGWWRVAAALPLGAVAFISVGVLLGSLLPSARSAQAVGLLIFFPSFLLGAGGPQPHASGFVLKGVPAGDLHRAVRVVADGGAWLDPAVTSRVLAIYRSAAPPRADRDAGLDALTGREREVLALIGHGNTNTEIAAELFVSEGTVKTHINHLFTKLQLRHRAAAVVFAFDHDLVTPLPDRSSAQSHPGHLPPP